MNSQDIDVSTWRPKITYGIEKYNQKNVIKWKKLYEEFGSYNYIKDLLRNEEGEGPSDTTIKERLQNYFKEKDWDFKNWEARYKRNIQLQKYGDKEELFWMKLYEELASFRQVSIKLGEVYNKVFRSSSIRDRIKRRFLRQNIDFKKGENEYKQENPTKFKSVYSEQELNLWIQLFEKYGFLSKVSEEFEEKTGNQISNRTILYRIEKKFEEEGKDFEEWYEKNRKSTKGFEKKYNMEDLNEWESLFEQIGSFCGVSYYLNEVRGDEDGPHGKTIKDYLKQKFRTENRDFKKWIINFYSPNHERANIIRLSIHFIMENLFIENQLRKGNIAFYEISPTDGRNTVSDNALLNLKDNIKMKCIDYSTSRYKENLFDKLYKNYQSSYRELIIVPLLIDKNIKLSKNIKKELRRNVKILNKDKFAKWMRYNEQELKLYNIAIEYAKTALYDDDDFDKLKELGKKAEYNLYILQKKYPIGEQGFQEYLKKGTKKDYSYLLKDLEFRSLEDY